MDKINNLIKSLNFIIKEDEENLEEEIGEIEGLETVIDSINKYEKKLAKLFRKQKKYYIDGINEYIAKDVALKDLINYVMQDLTAADTFINSMSDITIEFLQITIKELCTIMMDTIDKDVQFEVFSQRTIDWISNWAFQLGQLMQINTSKALETLLNNALENGEGINKIVEELKELPEFDRRRAKVTAVTEMLTAHSRSLWESYSQSPAVTGKTWKHSGGKAIEPREDHKALDGTTINVDDFFLVGGEKAQYPRDTSLSAKQRVNCHCTLGPSVDQDIIKLSKEEKLKLREQALKELEEE